MNQYTILDDPQRSNKKSGKTRYPFGWYHMLKLFTDLQVHCLRSYNSSFHYHLIRSSFCTIYNQPFLFKGLTLRRDRVVAEFTFTQILLQANERWEGDLCYVHLIIISHEIESQFKIWNMYSNLFQFQKLLFID